MSDPLPSKAPWHPLPRDQAVLCVLCLVLFVVAAGRYAWLHWRAPAPVRKLDAGQRVDYRVDLNRAGVEELDLLPGIGPAKAARIVAHREAHGPFQTASDLSRIPGFSRRCVEGLRGLVTPEAAAAEGESVR